MKKQILIVFTGPLELGGIERSLLALLDSIDYDHYEVDLFLYGHHGSLFSGINPKVNLLPEIQELAYLRESFLSKLKHKCFYSAALRLRDALFSKFMQVDHDDTWAQIVRRYVSPFEKKYDLAIGFFRPFDLIIEKVDAIKKVGWIHTDYRSEKKNLSDVKKDFERLDYIVAVSEQVAESFRSLFPSLKSKVIVIENILPENMIHIQAEEKIKIPENDSIMLLSIGRFSYPKNFDNVPDICRRIIERGYNITWYLIGYGPDEALIHTKIQEAGMQDHVIILGKRENPYPYIKACNLYVQPSRYEGKCVAVREAQMLGKPVVITDYATSGSQLEDGVDGVIVPMDNDGCAEGIVSLLHNPTQIESIVNSCSLRDYSNIEEVHKIYKMIH